MTRQQISEAFPGQLTTLKTGINKLTETLGIDQVVLAGLPFQVLFSFDGDGGLREIVFDSPDSKASEGQFRKLEDWVSHEYGQRPIRGVRGGDLIYESYWLLPDNVMDIIWTRTGILVFGFSRPKGETAASLFQNGLVPIQEKLSIRTDLPAPSSSLKSAAAGTSQAGKWQVSESFS
jgi:hypothetical protein